MRIVARVNATATLINAVQTPFVAPLGSTLTDVYYKDNKTGTPSTITWDSATSTITIGLGADVSISFISAGSTSLSGYTLLVAGVNKVGFKMSTAGGLAEIMHVELDAADDGITNREAVTTFITTYNTQVLCQLFNALLGVGVSNGLITVLASGNAELEEAIDAIPGKISTKSVHTYHRNS